METALDFLVKYENWFYAALGLAALLYLTRIPGARRRLSGTLFGLEKEQARGELARAIAMLVIALSSIVAVFVVNAFVVPSLPARRGPGILPTPTSVVPTGPAPEETLQFPSDGAASLAALDQQVDTSGCLNLQATLAYPADHSQVAGSIEVRGTADIPNFALYKYEIAGAYSGGHWLTLAAGTTPVKDGLLGTWESATVPPGAYAFRLVVSDTSGNSPPPCARVIEVLPPGQSAPPTATPES